MQVDVQQIKDQIAEKADLLDRLNTELRKKIVGQEQMISRLLVGLLAEGHILLEGLFLVMATQNPIEQEGTYPLPEAQVDRFMLKIKIDYPQPDEERKVLDMALDGTDRPVQAVLSPEEILGMQQVVKRIYVDDQIKDYILRIVQATRTPATFNMPDLGPLIDYGGSPRATIYLGIGARAMAFLNGRGYVTPQDVKDIAYDVLRHRLILSYEAEAEQKTPEDLIATILSQVPVP